MQLKRDQIPLYYQLQQLLRKKILSGTFPIDTPLPTENELCKDYKVSRTTVRQAFAALKNEGLIFRIPGKGTYIAADRLSDKIMHYFSTVDSIGETLKFASLPKKIHHKGVVAPSARIASIMGLEPGEKIFCTRGVRFQNEYPFCYFMTSTHPDFIKDINLEGIKSETVLKLIIKKTGIKLQRVTQKIRAVKANEKVAKFLDIKKDIPLLELECIYISENDKIIEVGLNHFNGELFSYSMDLEQKN